MNKFILTVAVLTVCTTSLLAQSFGASSILLRAPGSAFSVTLNPPALTGNHTFTFPNASGTLLVSADLATSAWTFGGNSLVAPGPTTNVLGTTSAHDVVMTAGGLPATNTRLTLLSGSNAVQTGAGTELRLLNPLGTNHTSFKAGTQIANIEYILPTSGPTVANQVLRATNTGNPVVLEWATVSGGGGSGSFLKIQGSDQTTTSGTLHTSMGLQYVLATGTTYSVTGTIRVSTVNASNDPTIRFTSPGVGSTINLTLTNGGTTVNVTAFETDYTLNNTTTGMEDWSVSGSISTSVAVAASGLQFSRTSSSNMTLGAGSNLFIAP